VVCLCLPPTSLKYWNRGITSSGESVTKTESVTDDVIMQTDKQGGVEP
jgi:hypothetical protein